MYILTWISLDGYPWLSLVILGYTFWLQDGCFIASKCTLETLLTTIHVRWTKRDQQSLVGLMGKVNVRKPCFNQGVLHISPSTISGKHGCFIQIIKSSYKYSQVYTNVCTCVMYTSRLNNSQIKIWREWAFWRLDEPIEAKATKRCDRCFSNIELMVTSCYLFGEISLNTGS